MSNSSSSSFTCEICGETFSGWDGDYGEVEEYCCKNSHYMCSACVDLEELLTLDDLLKYWEAFKHYDWLDAEYRRDIEEAIVEQDKDLLYELLIADGDYDYYDLEPEICPCCNFKTVAYQDMETYLLTVVGKNWNMVRDEMKQKFKNYKEFEEFKKNIPIRDTKNERKFI